jgi:hypothetical protein
VRPVVRQRHVNLMRSVWQCQAAKRLTFVSSS